jgi:hypothetical protein
VETDRLGELVTLIGATVRRAHEHRHAYGLQPYRGSRAKDELEEPDPGESMQNAHTIGLVLIVAAEDLLPALARGVQERQAFAVSVLARSVLETCARSRWLLDRDADPRERLRRGYTEWMYSLWEQWRIVDENPLKSQLARRIDDEVAEARVAGFEVYEHRRFKGLHYCEAERPRAGALIDDLLRSLSPGLGGFAWSFYSAVAHGTAYALLQVFSEREGPLPSDAPPAGLMVKRPQDVDLRRPAAFALLGYLAGFAEMVELNKWDPTHWQTWRSQHEPELLLDLVRE